MKPNEDKHLNIYWAYGRKKSDEGLDDDDSASKTINNYENNITRGVIISFSHLSDKNKIIFLNTLLGKKVLSTEKKYNYFYELQTQKFKEELIDLPLDDKYLVGFCPDGGVRDKDKQYKIITKDENEIIKAVEEQPIEKNPNPDACIVAKENNKIVLAIAFENKKESLLPGQLHRHLVKYLGISKAKNHLLVKSYSEFFDLFSSLNLKSKEEEYFCNSLLDYIKFLALYAPSFSSIETAYKHFKETNEYSEDEFKKLIDDYLGKIMDKIFNNVKFGKRRIQKGWGHIIDVSSESTTSKMLGLVWNKNNERVELNIKFASNMETAKSFYKKYDFTSIPFVQSFFKATIEFSAYGRYLKDLHWSFRNIEKYFNFFRDAVLNNRLVSVGKGTLERLLEEMNDKIEKYDVNGLLNAIKYDSKKEKRTAYLKSNLGLCPSLEIIKGWTIMELSKTKEDDFVQKITEIIKEAKPLIFD